MDMSPWSAEQRVVSCVIPAMCIRLCTDSCAVSTKSSIFSKPHPKQKQNSSIPACTGIKGIGKLLQPSPLLSSLALICVLLLVT